MPKRPLIEKPHAPDVDPKLLKVYDRPRYGIPEREHGYPELIVLRYVFKTGRLLEMKKAFYLSKTGLYCFKFGHGLFNGMKEESFGQFEFHRYDAEKGIATMYTSAHMYHKDKTHFLKCCIRIQRRLQEADLKKFVGGVYK